MKILITGTDGLAKAIGDVYHDHNVTLVSRATGNDIKAASSWAQNYFDHDIVFNCAYDKYGQVSLLMSFYKAWADDPTKTIVNIGSRVIYGITASQNFEYATNKESLLDLFESLLKESPKCNIKLINPGPIDTAMVKHLDCVKMEPNLLAHKIRAYTEDNTVKRVDLWL